jgi:hypothetical protein
MNSSKDLLREIEYELSNIKNKSPMTDLKPTRQAEMLKSDELADRILDKIRKDKEKLSAECRKIKNQLLQILGDERKRPGQI